MSREPITIEQLHMDVMAHARSITILTEKQGEFSRILDELKTDRAVRKERDRNLNERLDRIDGTIKAGILDLRQDMEERFSRFSKPIGVAIAALITTSIGTFMVFILRGGISG